jgi:hypothetical protein
VRGKGKNHLSALQGAQGRRLFVARMAAAVLGMAAWVGSAAAATVSYSFSYGPESVPQSSHLVGTLPLFNPALGTLTQVDLTLDASTDSGTIAWDNESGVATNITLGVGATVTVTSSVGGLAATAVPLQSGSATGIAADNDGAPDFLGADSFAVTGGSGFDSDTDTITGGGVAPFYGVGTFTVDGDSVLATQVITSGGFGPTQHTLGETEGDVTVTYYYTPIPEPSTLSLLALGTVGLLGVRRRK